MSREEQIAAAQAIIGELDKAELIVGPMLEYKSDRQTISGQYAQKYYDKHLKNRD